MRLTKEQLQKVKDKYGVDRLYSWSRINCFMTSKYEYFLRYVLNEKEANDNCAYAPLGGCVHSIIENYYNGSIKYEDMINNFEDIWLTTIDLADLKFDRNDEEKNSNIKSKYKQDLEGFFNNHKPIQHKVELERFLSAKIGDYVLQGYSDAIYKDDEGYYNIVDWKSSSKYSAKALEEHSGQLTVYAIALNQLGVPLDNIKCCFNFLKYCTVQYEQANGAIKTRDVERYKLGESLQSNLKTWLKKLGYEDQLDEYLKLVLDTNSIDCLPDDVKAKYVISDCWVYIDLTQKLVDKWIAEITSTIKDIEMREADYAKDHNEKIWWDSEEDIKAQSYYYATLCGYSANQLKPYKEYLDKLDREKNGDIFGNLLNSSGITEITSDGKDTTCNNDLDLSWLNSI